MVELRFRKVPVMNILICYATTEGHTRKVALHAADFLMRHGCEATVENADSAEDLDLTVFDAAILAGSVHIGRYQTSLDHFVRSRIDQLNARPTAFLSVSLSAAGDADDRKDADELATGFLKATGWTADMVHNVAGAFRFTQYDFFKRWAMRLIALQKGETVDTRQDREYTDWIALDDFLDSFEEHARNVL